MTALATLTEPMAPRASVADFVGYWVIACCEPQYEHRVVRELTERDGIPSFWPRVEVIRRVIDKRGHEHNNREKRSLFGGYISFCCGEGQQHRVSGHDDVYEVIWEPIQSKFIREISLVETALLLNPRMNTYPVSTIGDRCRIKSGPYQGTEGKLIKIRDESQFVVEIETFGGRLVDFTTDPALLEPV